MPTRRGATLAGLGAVGAAMGVAAGVEELVLLATAVAALLVVGAGWVAVRVARARGRVGLRWWLPSDLTVGVAATAALDCRAEGRRLAGLELEDPSRRFDLSRPGLGRPAAPAPRPARRVRRVLPPGAPLPPLPPDEVRRVAVAVPTGARGLLRVAPLRVAAVDPLGLLRWPVAAAPAAHAVVAPAVRLEAPPTPSARSRPDTPAAPQAAARAGGAGDELGDLRSYRPGDHLSRLHWPSAARGGDLLVRDFLPAVEGTIGLLVDLRADVHHPGSLDAVVGRAAAVGSAALAAGVGVELLTSAGDRLRVAPTAEGRRRLLRALAVVDPVAGPPRWPVERGPLVVLSTTTGERSAPASRPAAAGVR